eukprot:462276_1
MTQSFDFSENMECLIEDQLQNGYEATLEDQLQNELFTIMFAVLGSALLMIVLFFFNSICICINIMRKCHSIRNDQAHDDFFNDTPFDQMTNISTSSLFQVETVEENHKDTFLYCENINSLIPILSTFIEYLDYLDLYAFIEAYPSIKNTIEKAMDSMLHRNPSFYGYDRLKKYIMFSDDTTCDDDDEPQYNEIFIQNWSFMKHSSLKEVIKQQIIKETMRKQFANINCAEFNLETCKNGPDAFKTWFKFNHYAFNTNDRNNNEMNTKYRFTVSIANKLTISNLRKVGIVMIGEHNLCKVFCFHLWNRNNYRFILVQYKATEMNKHGYFLYFIRLDNLLNVIKIHSGPLEICCECSGNWEYEI